MVLALVKCQSYICFLYAKINANNSWLHYTLWHNNRSWPGIKTRDTLILKNITYWYYIQSRNRKKKRKKRKKKKRRKFDHNQFLLALSEYLKNYDAKCCLRICLVGQRVRSVSQYLLRKQPRIALAFISLNTRYFLRSVVFFANQLRHLKSHKLHS